MIRLFNKNRNNHLIYLFLPLFIISFLVTGTEKLRSQTVSENQKVVRLNEKLDIQTGSPMHFIQENIHKIPEDLQKHYNEVMRLYEQEYQLVHISKIPMMNKCLSEIFSEVEDSKQRLHAGLIFLESAPGDHNQDGRIIVADFLDYAFEKEIITDEILENHIEPAIEKMFDWTMEFFYNDKVRVFKALKENIRKNEENIRKNEENIRKNEENISELNRQGFEWFDSIEKGIKDNTVRGERLIGIKEAVLERGKQLKIDIKKSYPEIWKALHPESKK